MEIRRCDNFYNNDGKTKLFVTYEIENTGVSDLVIEDEKGNALTTIVHKGKKEDHTFEVPPGGKLHCRDGKGECTLKNIAPPPS